MTIKTKTQWRQIAGRGEGMCMNWGFDDDITDDTYAQWYQELKQHIGEKVALTGGGGFGVYGYGILNNVKLAEFPITAKNSNKIIRHVPKVTIKNLQCPNKPYSNRDTFSPWINSWQIWVEDK